MRILYITREKEVRRKLLKVERNKDLWQNSGYYG